jgi:DNA-binding CsgD family transcriptional regulator
MELWQRLLAILRMQPVPGRRFFELDEPLQSALAERADQEQLPVEQIQADLLAAGLANLQTSDGLKRAWGRLSPREQEVTALTCLSYTNRQMAARMCLSPATVKGYVRQVMIKFNLHGKDELRLLLAGWDFNDWAPPPSE